MFSDIDQTMSEYLPFDLEENTLLNVYLGLTYRSIFFFLGTTLEAT